MSERTPETTFLCVSNARSGSTHLITSLNRLDGVSSDFELKWNIKYRPGAVHVPLRPGDDVGAIVREKVGNLTVVGSKLVLDPYPQTMLSTVDADGLIAAIDRDIALIHLTRDYFDGFVSMFYRGAHHQVANPGEAASTVLARDALAREQALPNAELKIDPATIPIILLNMFHNDLVALELCARADRSTHVAYAEIDARLAELARFLGVEVSEELVHEITDRPTLRKLPPIDLSGAEHVDEVRALAARFTQALAHYRANGLPATGRPLVLHPPGAAGPTRIEVTDGYLQEILG